MSHSAPLTDEELLLEIEGELPPSRQREVREHLATCGECRKRAVQIKAVIEAMRTTPATLAGTDLVADVRRRVAAEPSRRSTRRLGVWIATAASIAAVIIGTSLRNDDDEFRVKSAGRDAAWVDVAPYAVRGGEAVRVTEGVSADDALVFSYANSGARPFGYLMIFSVDARGEIHWYYPAYTETMSDPASVVIASGSGYLRLPDAVRHDLSAGPLVLVGLFSRRAFRVSAVEQRLRGVGADGDQVRSRLVFDDAVIDVTTLNVR
jgi:hypothetical protein